MNLPVVILRPFESAQQTAVRVTELGLKPIIDPLFAIESLDWNAEAAQEFDAIMFTSANAIKFGGAKLEEYRSLPALVVGEASALVAKDAGFEVAVTGSGGAAELCNATVTQKYKRILRLTGEDFTAVESDDHEITVYPVYRSMALPLGNLAQGCFTTGAVILLHSSRAAQQLLDEMSRLNLSPSNIRIAALSSTVAKAAGAGWQEICAVSEPTDDALLSAARQLCQI